MHQQSSKLNNYFENLRTCNVISSLIGQVGSIPPPPGGSQHSSSSSPATAMPPTPFNPDITAPSSGFTGDHHQLYQGSAPGSGGFGNYLSKLQTICTDNNTASTAAATASSGELGFGQHNIGKPVYDSLKSLQNYNTLSARI